MLINHMWFPWSDQKKACLFCFAFVMLETHRLLRRDKRLSRINVEWNFKT